MKEKHIREIQEVLHPDLWDYLDIDGGLIDHPLVRVSVLDPQDAERATQLYEKKIDSQDRAAREEDWETYVFLHERPYRIGAFMDIRAEVTDRQYWELLSHVWMDTEYPWQNLAEWMALWGSNRPEKNIRYASG